MNQDWEKIKDLLHVTTKIPKDIVDIIADDEILSLCASGYDIKMISVVLNIDEEEIKQLLQKYFGFDGFESRLPFDPLKYYKSNYSDAYLYVDAVCSDFPFVDSKDLKTSYYIAKEYIKLKERVDMYYANPSS